MTNGSVAGCVSAVFPWALDRCCAFSVVREIGGVLGLSDISGPDLVLANLHCLMRCSRYLQWKMRDLKCCYFAWRGAYLIETVIERIALSRTLCSALSRVSTSRWDFFVLKFSTSVWLKSISYCQLWQKCRCFWMFWMFLKCKMFLNNHTQALLCSWEWCDEKLSTTLNVKESLRVFKNIQLQMFHGLGGFLEYSMFFFRFSSNLDACVPDLSPWFICVSIIKHVKWVTHAYERQIFVECFILRVIC